MAIGGFMHNIQHRNRPFHVETEYYSGGSRKLVVTVIYEGGVVRKKISNPPESEDDKACRRQMANQHKQALKSILTGEFDPPDPSPAEVPSETGVAAKPTETADATDVPIPDADNPVEEAAATPRLFSSTPESEVLETEEQKDAARTVGHQLRKLSSMLGFVGLGIYAGNGQPLLEVESGRYALREHSEDFNDFLRTTHPLAASRRMGRVQSLFLGGEDLGLVVMFFPPRPGPPAEENEETPSHILLLMRCEAPWGDAERMLKDLLVAIQVAPSGLTQWLKMKNDPME